jgi:hypothetical protein
MWEPQHLQPYGPVTGIALPLPITKYNTYFVIICCICCSYNGVCEELLFLGYKPV